MNHEQPQEAVANRLRRPLSTRRMAVWAGIVLALLIVWFAAYGQSALLAREVEPLRQKHMEENEDAGHELASLVTVARDALVLGTPRAKIEIFVRPEGRDDARADFGVEYLYERRDGEWLLIGSAACTSETCLVRGQQAFAN